MPSSPDPGLCSRCVNMRVVASDRGSRFILCELSRTDDRFPRYPRLPVIACAGFGADLSDRGIEPAPDTPPRRDDPPSGSA